MNKINKIFLTVLMVGSAGIAYAATTIKYNWYYLGSDNSAAYVSEFTPIGAPNYLCIVYKSSSSFRESIPVSMQCILKSTIIQDK